MWCNWGFMGRGMWGPHGFGFLGMLLMAGLVVWVIYLVIRWLRRVPEQRCPACNGGVQAAFLRCPHCGASLKRHCPHCSTIIEASWKFCPSCAAEISGND